MNGNEIPLNKGSNIPSHLIHPEAKAGDYPKDYAQVAWDPDKRAMVLINGSRDKWTVGTGQKISANEEVKLGEKPLTIVFSPGVKGALKPAADTHRGQNRLRRSEASLMIEEMLKRGQVLIARNMQSAAVIEDTLGEGAQAEVYRARIGDAYYALKWYRPEYLAGDQRLWERLKVAINSGTPAEQFLWPFDLVSYPRDTAYGGYLMPIKTPDFVSMVDLMRRQAEPLFPGAHHRGLQTGTQFLELHAAGLCYRDINFGNVFFNPLTGDIRIADTDNVDVNLKPGSIKGTPGFMAPEVANNLVEPNAANDRFSLAVLLFFIFVIGHPLKGKRELTLPYDASDPDQSHRLCAKDPVFIFDPNDDSNRPQPGVHDNPLSFWPIYPGSLRKLFVRAFTAGLHDPEARVMENEWRKEMCALRDAIFHCPQCGAENFFDLDLLRQKKALDPCGVANRCHAILLVCACAQPTAHSW